MVMMEKPSPIQVGREFVRQYYTLLNKAPELLHRFYSINSSYVHGGRYCNGEPEQPVIGQNEIHLKINSLKFHDCRTKIRQVDAHSTIGSGVVVQVTGELSNEGMPLRRFMQTFVLAPQGDNPYKFYVHNDIFRYQDEVFMDNVPNDRSDGEQESEEELEQSQAPTQVPAYQDKYSSQPATNQNLDEPTTLQQPPVMTNGLDQRLEESPVNEPVSNIPDVQEDQTPSPTRSLTPEIKREATPTPAIEDLQLDEPPKVVEQPKEEEAIVETKPTAPKILSWADRASKNTPAQSKTQQGTVVKVHQQPEPTEPTEAPPRAQRPQRPNQRNYQRDDDRDRGFGDRSDQPRRSGPIGAGTTGPPGGRDQMPIRYPDQQQIFVGNLPYDISESDLKDHFADFGKVIEVRINHSHSNNPSFGFVIFEECQAVDRVLEVMPTHYKDKHRINIEEKKQRSARDNNRRIGGDQRRGPGMMGDGRGARRGGGGGPMGIRRDRQGSREARDGQPRPSHNTGQRR
uniref:Ras GTPase-activating protein-binding protein 2 n=1 Tax=Phallusia mammillata TaxID=59560 RepID=A0A6F9DDY0_9ASCI|nr:ras GTPase-activating protein-binding protein 2 [Phallusia mammillata]